jgi:LacI family transcriptional regulator
MVKSTRKIAQVDFETGIRWGGCQWVPGARVSRRRLDRSFTASPSRQTAVKLNTAFFPDHYGRGIVEGAALYSRERGNWVFYFEPRGLEQPPAWIGGWQGDGVIARFPNRDIAAEVIAKGVPIVDLYGSLTETRLPHVAGDNSAIVKMAFDHLWERGLRRFGFCGQRPGVNPYTEERGELLRRLANDAGCPCSIFASNIVGVTMTDWEEEQAREAAWIQSLEKPTGILAVYDELGCHLLTACLRYGIRVPEEVAIISVGNDPVLCETSIPPMSSVSLDSRRIGYEAAAILDRLMKGQSLPAQPIRFAPLGLAARASTDILAIGDAEVATALQFIRENACQGIRVVDIARHAGLSLSVIERRFRSVLGRSPKAELLRVQVSHARELLAESDLPLKQIAKQCGFGSEKYFSDAFLRETGGRPGAYRKNHRWPSV